MQADNRSKEKRIVCAAVLLPCGVVVCGPRHFDATMRANIEKLRLSIRGAIQGFVDQFGTFMTREEAHVVAHRAGQIATHADGDRLYSEDLY